MEFEMRNPDFNNLLKVLNKKAPDRPTLFEFFLNVPLYEKLAGDEIVSKNRDWQWGSVCLVTANAYKNAGYDYLTCYGSDFRFPQEEIEHKVTISLNAGHSICDRDSFKSYDWPDPANPEMFHGLGEEARRGSERGPRSPGLRLRSPARVAPIDGATSSSSRRRPAVQQGG